MEKAGREKILKHFTWALAREKKQRSFKVRVVKLFLAFVFLSVFHALALQDEAYAYIDPGSGSYFLQIFLAGILAVLFSIKAFWRKVKALFLAIISRSKKNDREKKSD